MSSALDRLWRRLRFSLARGRISGVNDAGVVQKLQAVLGNGQTFDLRRVVEFGLASNPPLGTDAIVVFVAGDRANGVVIGTNDQATRPTGLAAGESQVYNAFGVSIYLSESGLVINGGNMPITIQNAPQVNINGAQNVEIQASTDILLDTPLLKVTGDILDNCNTNTDTLAQLRADYDEHNHQVAEVATGSSTITTTGPSPTA